jgi:hypothetical protein
VSSQTKQQQQEKQQSTTTTATMNHKHTSQKRVLVSPAVFLLMRDMHDGIGRRK